MKHSLFTLGIVADSLSVATLSCTTQQHPTEVTWGTFNIRYDNPGDSLNNWQYRKDNVAQFIKSQDIDIVGMQEVLHNQLEDLKSRLPEYAEVGVGREDGKTKGEYSPLFYKKDRFEVLDSNTFWLSQYPDSVGFMGRSLQPHCNMGKTEGQENRKDLYGSKYPFRPCRNGSQKKRSPADH